ncbi:hypothetical protein [Pedobacter sp. R20-19]|uniref:hypothetical protein n=1 Tax=Pedobacter sp. R20-19 TaxID=1270196 RepID=UPI0004936794|nr:hypothetical protein [Pedobacter sp. R20-19]
MGNNYKDLKDWFSKHDFSIDTRISIGGSKNNGILKIRKISYSFEDNKYEEIYYPIELHSYKLLVNNKEVDFISYNNWVNEIIVIDHKEAYLKITFYGSENVLLVISKVYHFHNPYRIPYKPPLRVKRNSVTIRMEVDGFNYETLKSKFQERNIVVSLREYFGKQVNLSKNKEYR